MIFVWLKLNFSYHFFHHHPHTFYFFFISLPIEYITNIWERLIWKFSICCLLSISKMCFCLYSIWLCSGFLSRSLGNSVSRLVSGFPSLYHECFFFVLPVSKKKNSKRSLCISEFNPTCYLTLTRHKYIFLSGQNMSYSESKTTKLWGTAGVGGGEMGFGVSFLLTVLET